MSNPYTALIDAVWKKPAAAAASVVKQEVVDDENSNGSAPAAITASDPAMAELAMISMKAERVNQGLRRKKASGGSSSKKSRGRKQQQKQSDNDDESDDGGIQECVKSSRSSKIQRPLRLPRHNNNNRCKRPNQSSHVLRAHASHVHRVPQHRRPNELLEWQKLVPQRSIHVMPNARPMQ